MTIDIDFDPEHFTYRITFHSSTMTSHGAQSSYQSVTKKFKENGVVLPPVEEVSFRSGEEWDHCGPGELTGKINCLKALLITLEQKYFTQGANIVSIDHEFCRWSDNFLVAFAAVKKQNLINDPELEAIKDRFYAVQNTKYSSLLHTRVELEAIAKNLSL